jgi:hypothetical protein
VSERTAIEWTDATWNPVTGCTKVSPGCAYCYIERTPPMRMAGRRFVDGKIPVQLRGARQQAATPGLLEGDAAPRPVGYAAALAEAAHGVRLLDGRLVPRGCAL